MERGGSLARRAVMATRTSGCRCAHGCTVIAEPWLDRRAGETPASPERTDATRASPAVQQRSHLGRACGRVGRACSGDCQCVARCGSGRLHLARVRPLGCRVPTAPPRSSPQRGCHGAGCARREPARAQRSRAVDCDGRDTASACGDRVTTGLRCGPRRAGHCGSHAIHLPAGVRGDADGPGTVVGCHALRRSRVTIGGSCMRPRGASGPYHRSGGGALRGVAVASSLR